MVDFEYTIKKLLLTSDYDVYTGSLPNTLPDKFVQVLLLGGKDAVDNVIEEQTVYVNIYSREEKEARNMSFKIRDKLKRISESNNILNDYNLYKLRIMGLITNPDPDQVEYYRYSINVIGETRNNA